MKTILDPRHALDNGLADIRRQYQLPDHFPPEALAAADAASRRAPSAHLDRTGMRFVTLDPASSTDLDQAFAIERSGNDLLLHYAIADVAWFVAEGDAVDLEAWRRGTSQYLPDGKVSLYPPVLSENAASLLTGGPRPAVIFTVRIDAGGDARLDNVARAIIRNSAKLAYDSVRDEDLPANFAALAARVQAAENRRGASRVEPPEQEVEQHGNGQYELRFRPRLLSEDRNAALSLAANLAVAEAFRSHKTGLFRVMPGPDARATERLRQTARALGLEWPCMASLAQFERMLNPAEPRQAAFMMAIRRAGSGASYQPYEEGVIPWHAAIAAPYAHATAPLRRLADRYVVRAALAIANGQPVPDEVEAAFARLPPVMERAGNLGGQIERAVIDLAEAVTLQGRIGETFDALVTEVDERGARIQLCNDPVVARVATDGLEPGMPLKVALTEADPAKRKIAFETVS